MFNEARPQRRERKGVCQVESAVGTPAVEEADVVEKLRGQLMAALSLLMELGFDAAELRDCFWA